MDLVQEFTVEGQCSKIKVRSCRITWDSLQVNTAQPGCMLMAGLGGGVAGCRSTDCYQHELQDTYEAGRGSR